MAPLELFHSTFEGSIKSIRERAAAQPKISARSQPFLQGHDARASRTEWKVSTAREWIPAARVDNLFVHRKLPTKVRIKHMAREEGPQSLSDRDRDLRTSLKCFPQCFSPWSWPIRDSTVRKHLSVYKVRRIDNKCIWKKKIETGILIRGSKISLFGVVSNFSDECHELLEMIIDGTQSFPIGLFDGGDEGIRLREKAIIVAPERPAATLSVQGVKNGRSLKPDAAYADTILGSGWRKVCPDLFGNELTARAGAGAKNKKTPYEDRGNDPVNDSDWSSFHPLHRGGIIARGQ
jgi:hypothetical protein